MTESKLIYIVSPYAGDVPENILAAQNACRYAMAQGAVPIAVHLMYPQFLDDGSPEDREAGLQMGIRVLKACDELWLCGDRVSAGMQRELDAAVQIGIPIRRINSQELAGCLAMEPGRGFPGMGMGG